MCLGLPSKIYILEHKDDKSEFLSPDCLKSQAAHLLASSKLLMFKNVLVSDAKNSSAIKRKTTMRRKILSDFLASKLLAFH